MAGSAPPPLASGAPRDLDQREARALVIHAVGHDPVGLPAHLTGPPAGGTNAGHGGLHVVDGEAEEQRGPLLAPHSPW